MHVRIIAMLTRLSVNWSWSPKRKYKQPGSRSSPMFTGLSAMDTHPSSLCTWLALEQASHRSTVVFVNYNLNLAEMDMTCQTI